MLLNPFKRAAMNKQGTYVPEPTREALINYIEHGIQPGSFLKAVLENDLVEAVRRSDAINALSLSQIVNWLEIHGPNGCYGHKGVIEEWRDIIKTIEHDRAHDFPGL